MIHANKGYKKSQADSEKTEFILNTRKAVLLKVRRLIL